MSENFLRCLFCTVLGKSEMSYLYITEGAVKSHIHIKGHNTYLLFQFTFHDLLAGHSLLQYFFIVRTHKMFRYARSKKKLAFLQFDSSGHFAKLDDS